jgi:1-acyl-sn-glycerol-3-phosphate acyltransferase
MARQAHRSNFVKSMARALVRASGWVLEGAPPERHKFVLVGAPHTSRWDLWVTLLFSSALGIRLHWLGRDTLFWWPNRVLLTFLGGIPIDREGGKDAVKQVAARFAATDDLVIAISPEGAKRRREYWRSGFWHIAREADVPIVLAALDWKNHRCILGPTIQPTTLEADMDRIRAALAGVTPRHPERFGPIRVRTEIGADEVIPPSEPESDS